MTVLVVGQTGQLARQLAALLPQARFWSRRDADLTAPAELEAAIVAARPSALINAAAYTAVDRAEAEPALAWRVNAEAPAAMARAAATLSISFVHVSTDYVFDGRASRPWNVDDATAPRNVYGRTKLAGEIAVATLCTRHWILRTSWVFSEHGHNFVKTILRLARERDELRVVDDQRGVPTDALDLARIVRGLIEPAIRGGGPGYGIRHAVGGPAVTWREFAEAIVREGHLAGLLPRLVPVRGIRTADYPTPATRPANSVLAPSADLPALAGGPIDWRTGLSRVVRALGD
jgi:dTDP-4-dehydrorhamnose reductase